jgi:hypothetical protein
MTTKTVSTHKKWLPRHSKWVHLVPRDRMRRRMAEPGETPRPKAVAPPGGLPVTTLPVDCTGNATVSCPMDGNDVLGICGLAMCDHVDNIRSFGQGKAGFTQIHANLAALESQYEAVSGGDNGTYESMLVGVNGVWTATSGGLAGDNAAVVADHLDLDITDVLLTRYCHDQFFATCMAWSVPDVFLQGFSQGTVWPAAATPDDQNGHFTAQADVGGPTDVLEDGTRLEGFYRLYTWGSWCWVSPAFIASVRPEAFVTFSALQFNAAGYDSHGRHVSDQAAAWVALGGNAARVGAVVVQFPAKAKAT